MRGLDQRDRLFLITSGFIYLFVSILWMVRAVIHRDVVLEFMSAVNILVLAILTLIRIVRFVRQRPG